MSLDASARKSKDLGSAHSGVGHFLHQRISAMFLIPLSIWFGICVLGLVGANEPSVLIFLQNPLNALLMGAFVLISLFHMTLGLEEVINDYVPHEGAKLFLILLTRGFALAVASGCVFALLRIAI